MVEKSKFYRAGYIGMEIKSLVIYKSLISHDGANKLKLKAISM